MLYRTKGGFMSDIEQNMIGENAMNEDASYGAELSSNRLEEVAGGAQSWNICPNCGQGDMIKKRLIRNIMKFYCARCNVNLN